MLDCTLLLSNKVVSKVVSVHCTCLMQNTYHCFVPTSYIWDIQIHRQHDMVPNWLSVCGCIVSICYSSPTLTYSGQILPQRNIEFQLLPFESITDPPTFTLTCVTTGGPPTTVTWTRDTEIDYQSNRNFTFSRTVTNFTNSTYNNTLTVTGRYLGQYRMTAWNRNTVLYIDSRSATSILSVKGKHVMVH